MSNSLDLLSTLAYDYDIISFAKSKKLNLLDFLMAIDIRQCQLIAKSYKKGEEPTEKQLEFYQTCNIILGNLLAKEEADKLFNIELQSTFKAHPALFCNEDPAKSFIHKRIERYKKHKPELFTFLEEVQTEIRESKVSKIGVDKAA